VDDVLQWLKNEIKLQEQYCNIFGIYGIDGRALLELTRTDMKQMGLVEINAIQNIEKCIQNLKIQTENNRE